MTFSIPEEIFEAYQEVCDEFINNDNIGKACTLRYQPNITECPNCNFDSFTGKSANTYKAGGPLSFSNSLCPWCNGEGTKEVEVTESIRLRLYWSRKDWLKLGLNLTLSDGDLMTIGFIADMPKCLQATSIRVITSQAHYGFWDFVLAADPFPHGFGKDKYFIAFWKRK
jgi:hypothetical protein